MNQALILVDVQHDFLKGGALEVPDGNAVIPVLNRIQPLYGIVVATQDWHPPDHGSFASNHPGRKPFESAKLHGLDQVLWPDHCVQGSFGAEFHPDLGMNRVQAIFRKGMNPEIDSYSGFYDNGHRQTTGLAGYLRDRGVTKVTVGGLAADYCVYYTVMDAVNEGFEVTLAEDGTRPISQDAFNKIREELRDMGVRILKSSALISQG